MRRAKYFRRTLVGIALYAAMVPAVLAQDSKVKSGEPLVVGTNFGLAPWIMQGPSGPEGFAVDVTTEIAKRLGRPGFEILDINFSGLFAALFGGRIEFTNTLLNITEERSTQMLYTEPLLATGRGFVVRAGDVLDNFEELSGKVVAVNRGTIDDSWAGDNAEKYGFTVERYDSFPDAVQAVITGRAFVAINEIPTTVYAASKNSAIEVAHKDYSGRNFAFAFRNDDVQFRNQVEEIIECLKLNGTLHDLHTKWYGSPPTPGSAMDVVYFGFGPPGFVGHAPTAHVPACD
ncbi:amino acid ABC transporter substrate-binding protein [Pseudaminobacter arsenicus]|uniref:Amino acid ABC transporter substrate-binding protein n=1 Tax=Borborobacter arsenicus TaxID=1851146 RepID=A0A432V1D3_9HYPH|nr:ABC transporter substrate-binding protein [Pseudaminobacter arsenicus]RUM96007.1 amino acid ABC transporter substrate-binding protein [Pseudaminobacter arsenicus]